MSGKLITPKEAEAFYVRENEPTVAEIAYFPLSNYMAQVNVSLQHATNFFKTNESKYWLPERVQVQYNFWFRKIRCESRCRQRAA